MSPAAKWACTGALSCASSFIVSVIPWLQALALTLSVVASIRALVHSARNKP